MAASPLSAILRGFSADPLTSRLCTTTMYVQSRGAKRAPHRDDQRAGNHCGVVFRNQVAAGSVRKPWTLRGVSMAERLVVGSETKLVGAVIFPPPCIRSPMRIR